MLPVAAGANGTAADAAEAGIERAHAGLQRGERVGKAGVAGVVKVAAQRNAGHGFAHSRHDLRDLRGDADTDGIGQRDLERPGFGHALRDFDDAFHRDFTLERTTECRRDGHLRPDARLFRRTRDVEPGRDGFVGRDALVATIERVAGDHRHADLVASRRHRPLETLAVEHEADEVHARRRRAECLQHCFGVGHLRHFLRIDEARDLDAAQSGRERATNELDLGRRREHAGLALQPIAGTDFDDVDVRAHGGLPVAAKTYLMYINITFDPGVHGQG